MDIELKRQDGGYYFSRMLYELDINTLKPVVEN